MVFDLATYRTQIISQFAEQAETLRVGRFSSSALATAYNYDSDRANLFIILAAGVANQNAMLTTFTGQTPTDRQHTPVQLQAVARSYFDHIAGINTRLATATSAVNAATTQASDRRGDTMIENLVIQLIFKLTLAVAAIATARAAIAYLDRPFTHWLSKADDLSRAIYYSGRIIAVCVLVGFCVQ